MKIRDPFENRLQIKDGWNIVYTTLLFPVVSAIFNLPLSPFHLLIVPSSNTLLPTLH